MATISVHAMQPVLECLQGTHCDQPERRARSVLSSPSSPQVVLQTLQHSTPLACQLRLGARAVSLCLLAQISVQLHLY